MNIKFLDIQSRLFEIRIMTDNAGLKPESKAVEIIKKYDNLIEEILNERR